MRYRCACTFRGGQRASRYGFIQLTLDAVRRRALDANGASIGPVCNGRLTVAILRKVLLDPIALAKAAPADDIKASNDVAAHESRQKCVLVALRGHHNRPPAAAWHWRGLRTPTPGDERKNCKSKGKTFLVGHSGHLEHSVRAKQDLFFARARACAGGAV